MNLILELERAGFQFTIEGDQIRYTLAPGKEVDPATVKPLLEELRADKQDALAYLRQQTLTTEAQPRQSHPEPPAETPATLYQAVSDELAATYQAGTREYIERHRPELAQEIDEAETRLNAAWLAVDDSAGDLATFKEALENWRQANHKAIRAYNESQPMALAGADVAEVVKAVDLLCSQGYFLMHSRALEEQIAVIITEADRGRVPGHAKGVPVYTLAEIKLLAEGVKAGDLQRVADLLLLHTTKKHLGGVIVR